MREALRCCLLGWQRSYRMLDSSDINFVYPILSFNAILKARPFEELFSQRGLNRSMEPKQGSEEDFEANDGSRLENKPLRWGIAPVSLIADDFATALSVLPRENHQVMACTACYRTVAEQFAKKHGVPHIYNTFQELARSEDIDVVYISSLNPFHLEVGRMMLDHGKHVLCEKPLCVNEDQAIQLIGLSHAKQRFLLEGIFSRFVPAYQYIRKQIRDGAFGEIQSVNCSFGLPMQKVGRVMQRNLGGGVTLELGVFAIQLAQWAFRMQPYKIDATGKLNSDGVDEEASIVLNYGCDRQASIRLSSTERLDNVATIQGTKGCMTIPDYYCPTKIIDVDGKEKIFPLPQSPIHTHFPNRVALCFEAEEVRRCLNNNETQSDILNHNESIIIANIEDQIRKKLGVVYKEDNLMCA